MITGTHIQIRFSEPDDASFVQHLYLEGPPRAALLDSRRERPLPTKHDLREMLARKESGRGLLFTIEDRQGRLCGWCGVRGISAEARFAEVVLVFAEESYYASAAADEALDYLLERAFGHLCLAKIIVTCLDNESLLRGFLERRGMTSCGLQRQVLFSGGVWHDLHTFVLFASHKMDSNNEIMLEKVSV